MYAQKNHVKEKWYFMNMGCSDLNLLESSAIKLMMCSSRLNLSSRGIEM